jgi:hypothetical protein
MLPGVALRHGRPVHLELTETRGQSGTHGRIVADHLLRRPPP